jgi:uncharacterized protein (DUF58 family)
MPTLNPLRLRLEHSGSRTSLPGPSGASAEKSIVRRILRRSELFQYFTGRRRIDTMPITLQHRRVFILPTLHGFTFGIALVLMLVGSTNYSLGLGFALTFLLAGISIVGLVNTYRNIIGLRITMGRAEPVFAGDEAAFLMHVENPYRFARHSLETLRDGRVSRFDVGKEGWSTVSIAAAAPRRGWLPLGKVTLQTRYPLGLFRAWSPIRPDAEVLVYPRPEITPLPPELPISREGHALDIGIGGEDFAALRAYQPGDSPRHIAWKITARSDALVTKQFSSLGATELVFTWSLLPPGLDLETRLSCLAGWVIEAEASQVHYGLVIPGTDIEPGRGFDHRNQCLKALAVFDAGISR